MLYTVGDMDPSYKQIASGSSSNEAAPLPPPKQKVASSDIKDATQNLTGHGLDESHFLIMLSLAGRVQVLTYSPVSLNGKDQVGPIRSSEPRTCDATYLQGSLSNLLECLMLTD